MVGIGLEELGVEEFVQGKFFDGELFIDTKKKCYEDLKFTRTGFFGTLSFVYGKNGQDALEQVRKENIDGNILQGDKFQNGGTIIVKPGGEVLLSYVQEHPADHVPLADVLKALGIESSPEGATGGKPQVVCDQEACSIKK